jgi:hypothetical protein
MDSHLPSITDITTLDTETNEIFIGWLNLDTGTIKYENQSTVDILEYFTGEFSPTINLVAVFGIFQEPEINGIVTSLRTTLNNLITRIAVVIDDNGWWTSVHPTRLDLVGAWGRGQDRLDQYPFATAGELINAIDDIILAFANIEFDPHTCPEPEDCDCKPEVIIIPAPECQTCETHICMVPECEKCDMSCFPEPTPHECECKKCEQKNNEISEWLYIGCAGLIMLVLGLVFGLITFAPKRKRC